MYTYEHAIITALYSDLRRHPEHTIIVSISTVLHDITQFRRYLNSLLKPRRLGRVLGFLSPIDVESVPKGVVLIFGPSNYPVSLTLRPLVAAIAAGNCVLVKPSEYASESERILVEIIRQIDPCDGTIAAITGDVDVARQLMTKKWDHVLFTGSTAVGKHILRMAAETFTPVTLELGGKNPVVVASDADLAQAAHAIVKGRFMNSGQLCLAPDYCLVEDCVFDQFGSACIKAVNEQFGLDFERCDRYSRLSARTYSRVTNMLSCTHGKVIMGGIEGCNPETNYIPPTIVIIPSSIPSSPSSQSSTSTSHTSSSSCSWTDDALMSDEVFGPVLLLLRTASVQDAVAHIQRQPTALAMYVFTRSTKTARSVLDATRSGSAAVNQTLLQAASPGAFVAGVGESGMGGGYGSTEGFKTFSHQRVVLACSPAMGAVIETAMKTDKSEDEKHAHPLVSSGRGDGHNADETAKYLSEKMLGGAHRLVMLRSVGVAPTGAATRFMFEVFVWITDRCTRARIICFTMGVFTAVMTIGFVNTFKR